MRGVQEGDGDWGEGGFGEWRGREGILGEGMLGDMEVRIGEGRIVVVGRGGCFWGEVRLRFLEERRGGAFSMVGEGQEEDIGMAGDEARGVIKPRPTSLTAGGTSKCIAGLRCVLRSGVFPLGEASEDIWDRSTLRLHLLSIFATHSRVS